MSGEDDLIARHFAPLAGAGGLGLLDDAALVTPPPGHEIVATVDAVVAGVHFFADDPPAAIARKALRVNLSDLAAKGAEPLGFLLTLALPRGSAESIHEVGEGISPGAESSCEVDESWLEEFAASLGEDSRNFRCPLLGGDTVATPGPLTISITALGSVPAGRMVRRTTARPGDLVFMTGTIGDGALGLLVRNGRLADPTGELLSRYREPRPRNAAALAIRAHATAAMDVSDGLVGDLAKLCRASRVGALIDIARVPLSPAASGAVTANPTLRDVALCGGDDYEIVGTVAPERAATFAAACRAAGVPLTIIGGITTAGAPVVFRDASGAEIDFARPSFSHFGP